MAKRGGARVKVEVARVIVWRSVMARAACGGDGEGVAAAMAAAAWAAATETEVETRVVTTMAATAAGDGGATAEEARPCGGGEGAVVSPCW